ncbi:MAG: STAS-like domain-containing protein [Ignavibacteria bacterium]|nr:STAS-like domain-containing protein [Ignavibacteria bacterium]
MKHQIVKAADSSINPGLRYRWQSTYSGQEFFEDVLRQIADECKSIGDRLIVDLDGTRGYSSSFIDEIFGQLVVEFGYEWVIGNVETLTQSRPWLAEEAVAAMKDRRVSK